MSIWQDPLTERGFTAKRASVQRFVRPVIITAAGEGSQVGHSRRAVWLLTWKSSSKIWSELHEKAFRRLGGATQIVVLDNLREGVLKPDVYDPVLNPLYRDVLAHYGVTALPCRVRDPNRKGKVESADKLAASPWSRAASATDSSGATLSNSPRPT